MSSNDEPGSGRVAAVVVLTLDEASRIFNIAPELLVRLEQRLAGKAKRFLSSGQSGYFRSDIEEALAAERQQHGASE